MLGMSSYMLQYNMEHLCLVIRFLSLSGDGEEGEGKIQKFS